MGYFGTENMRFVMPEEDYRRQYGAHLFRSLQGEVLTGLSANSWNNYFELMNAVDDEAGFVVSPEIITATGISFEKLKESEVLINSRIEDVVDFSEIVPQKTFVLGTPLFVNSEKPQNSALIIKNGEILATTNKRSGATAIENEYFKMEAEESPLLLPGTKIGVVICSDLVAASLFGDSDKTFLNETLSLCGKQNLINKEVQIVHPAAESLLLVACWSVGGRFVTEGKADNYYQQQLTSIAWRVMRQSKVREVFVVDRLPEGLTVEQQKLTPNKPLNGVIRM